LLNLATVAVPLALDSPLVQTIAPRGMAFYQVASEAGGRFTVQFLASGFPARISLVDAQGQPLVQSDGSATGTGLIDENVPAGVDFLEVQSLGRGGVYQLSAHLSPTVPAFQTIPSLFNGATPMAVDDVNSDGIPDLITPDGVRLGVGDGTFQNSVTVGPLARPGFDVTGIVAGEFNNDRLPDFAVLETSSDDLEADVRVFLNAGGGQFNPLDPLPVDADANVMQAIDFGNGIVDLAITDSQSGTMTILEGDGAGEFTSGQTLDVGTDPVAMVAGRFGDGHLDLIVADQGDWANGIRPRLSVLQDDGTGLFQYTTAIPLASTPSALVAGDFGNGHLDLAVANSDTDDVTILLGNGNGTFQSQAPTSYPVGGVPGAIVACSLRDNGVLDLVTTNENSDDVSVLLGNDDGTFQPQVRYGVGSFPESIVAADLNGDNRPDLVVANAKSSDISILMGRGDGTFQDQVTNPVGNAPVDAVTADLNHDGYLDIITVNQYSNDISVLLGNGDGTFQPAESFAAGVDPTGLVVGDFNGDGRLDVAVADNGDSNGDGDGDGQGVSILLGNGDGTFQPPILYAAGASPWSIVAGDFTGTGVLDLAVTNPGSNDVSVLLGDGHGGFPTLLTIPLGDQALWPMAITLGDFTGSGVLDLAVANVNSDNVSILLGNGQGGFTPLSPVPLGDVLGEYQMALVAGDFTGDGVKDLAVVSASYDKPDSVSIIPGNSQGTFNVLSTIPLGWFLDPTSITTGRFFGDSAWDLATADLNTDQVSLLQGDGMGGFVLQSELSLGGAGTPIAITTGDFTGDGESDLAVDLQGPNSVTVELNQGNGQFAPPDSVGLVPRNTPLVADLNGDGVPDVTIVDGAGAILFRQGVRDKPGSFEPPLTINSGFPSRDIAAVNTSQGTLLASVDANDNRVSLFEYRDGFFSRVGSLATGLEPAQVVSADLDGDGEDDLIIRNAGDGTLSVYMSNGQGGFLSPISLAVGPGISDVSVADVNQAGLPDILLANQTAGEVEVILNRGDGDFSTPTLYRAGVGLSAEVGGTGTTPLSVFSQDGPVAVVAAALAPGAPPDLVALNSGAETLGVLTGLGDGLFANPYSLPTGPTSAIRIADLTGDGNADLAILGPDGVTIWLGNGQGGFVRGNTYPVGPRPTGLTVADVNGDNVPDLLVGNAFGDVLVLLGEGNGVFRPPTITDQNVSLAVAYLNGSGTPTFIFADQARDRVVVQTSPLAKPTVLGDRTTGLRVPRAPVLADLNGDGIPDLIVANTGGNNVLVYPGLPGGGFGPALNDGNGFPVGTNPVAVIVANLNGRPDLIVADQGSNDVSILLNEPDGNSFTFVPGPRLRVGAGPVALLYGDFFGNGTPDLLVSDSASNNLMLLPSLGNGFFNDVGATVIPLSESPGLIFAGTFGVGTGLDIVALDPGTSDVTVISGLFTGSPTSQVFSSGGLDPVAAFAVNGLNGFEDLVVANHADGQVALLAGGPHGLTVEEVNNSLDLLNPTGLALASLLNNHLEVYATTDGEEAASLLVFSLDGPSATSLTTGGQSLTLLPLQESSLPLIATLSTPFVDPNATAEEPGGSPETTAATISVSTTTATVSLGQGPFGNTVEHEDEDDSGEDVSEANVVPPTVSERSGSTPWRRVEIGLEEAFDEFRRQTQPKSVRDDVPEEDGGRPLPAPDPDLLLKGELSSDSRVRETTQSEIVDAAIDALVERAQNTPAARTFGSDGREGMTRVRLDSTLLTSMALFVLQGGLLLTSVRATERFPGPRGLPPWRTNGLRRSGGAQNAE
jgi:hypothetical protein